MLKAFFTAIVCMLVACTVEPRVECPAFDAAQVRFDELTASVLDTTFQDPRFVEAAELFEAVAPTCRRYEKAAAIARSIRAAQVEASARTPSPKAAPAARTLPKRSLGAPRRPTPKDVPLAAKCADLVDRTRRECPAGCRRMSPGAPAGACVDRCEDGLVEWLAQAGCPPVPRLPRASAPPPVGEAPPPAPPPPPAPSRRRKVARPASSGGAESPGGAQVYCAYFLPTGNHKMSLCTAGPLSAATARCNAHIAKKGIEGTCDCTDDEAFIGDRCR